MTPATRSGIEHGEDHQPDDQHQHMDSRHLLTFGSLVQRHPPHPPGALFPEQRRFHPPSPYASGSQVLTGAVYGFSNLVKQEPGTITPSPHLALLGSVQHHPGGPSAMDQMPPALPHLPPSQPLHDPHVPHGPSSTDDGRHAGRHGRRATACDWCRVRKQGVSPLLWPRSAKAIRPMANAHDLSARGSCRAEIAENMGGKQSVPTR